MRKSAPETMPWLSIWKTAPCTPCSVGGEDAGGDEAHMGDRGIGDQLLHVLLGKRHQRGVDDRDDAERTRPAA